MKHLILCTFTFGYIILSFSQSIAFQPLHSPVALLAGEGGPGYRDGAFWQARFNDINGLLLDEETNRLYVADSANRAIRVIDLHQNKVSTLVKSADEGSKDGAFGEARFGSVSHMIWGKDRTAIIFSDKTNNHIKTVDLKEKKIITLYDGSDKARRGNKNETLKAPQGLVYIHERQWLLIADNKQFSIKLLDLKSGRLSMPFRHSDMLDINNIILDRDNYCLYFTTAYKPGLFMLHRKDQPLRDKRIKRKDGEYAADLNKFLDSLLSGQQMLEHRSFQLQDQKINTIQLTREGFYYTIKRKDRSQKQAPLYLMDHQNRVQAIDLQQWMDVMPQAIWEVHKTREQEPMQKNQLFLNSKAMAVDFGKQEFYIADEQMHRILKIKFPGRHAYLPKEFVYSASAAENNKRVIVLGNSLNFMTADIVGEKEQWENSIFTVPKRMEYWFNLNSFLENNKQTVDIIYIGDLISKRSPMTNALNNIRALEDYQPELIIYNYTYWDLVYDSLDFLRKPPEGKYLHLDEDVEFKMTPIISRPMHPLGRELYQYIKNNKELIGKFATVDKKRVSYNYEYMIEMLKHSRNSRIFFKLAFYRIERLQKIIAAYNQEHGKNAELVINLLPLGCQLSRAEISTHARQGTNYQPHFLKQQFEFECKQRNIRLNDYIDRIRILAPSVFPMFNMPDNDHYSKKASDIIGYLLSRDLKKELVK